MANFNLATGAGVYFAEDMGVKGNGSTDDAPAIQAAINAISAGGTGRLLFAPKAYALGSKLTLASGVILQGYKPAYQEADNVVAVGTVFKALDPGFYSAITYNDSDLSAALTFTETYNAIAYGIGVKGFALDGFKDSLRIGGTFNPGCFSSVFSDILTLNSTGWGVWLENFGFFSRVENISAHRFAAGGEGGILIRGSSPPTSYTFGNSILKNLFVSGGSVYTTNSKGLVFDVPPGANMNDLYCYGLQCNTNGVLVTDTATITAATDSIAVANAANFPLDKPVTFQTKVGNLYSSRIYFIVASDTTANTIQVSDYYRGNVITPSVTGTATIQSNGFPGIQIAGQGPPTGGMIQSSWFTGIDIEGSAETLLHAQNGLGNLSLGSVSYNNGAKVTSTISLRDFSGSISATQDQQIDADGYAAGMLFFGGLEGFAQKALRGIVSVVGGNAHLNIGKVNYSFESHIAAGGDVMTPGGNIGKKVYRFSASHVFSGATGTMLVFNGTVASTATLPPLAGTGDAQTYDTQGITLSFKNASTAAVDLTVAADTTNPDYFDGITTVTSKTLAQGAAITVTAVYDPAATPPHYWVVTDSFGSVT